MDDPLVKYIKPFVDITLGTFTNFVGVEVTPSHPYFLDVKKEHEWDVSAVIGLSGAVKGAVIISLKKGLAIKFTDLLTATTRTEIDADVVDAIGEIVNIIAGNVKPKIPNGDRIVISIPTVIKGKEHSVAWPGKQARILCIPFMVFDDMFHLMVAIELES
jgi:chemotaxis protein CheX